MESAIKPARLSLLFVAALASVSAAEPSPVLEDAVLKGADIAQQAKEYWARKTPAAEPAKRVAAATPEFRLTSGGSVGVNEWGLVYSGQTEKCYNVKYVQKTEGDFLGLQVWANGVHVAGLNRAGESTEICGTRIHVMGVGYYGRGYWEATWIRP